jgi:catechol 2,3-dioxygenase-like lactoylglutathione lyase family enzyme
MEETMLDHVGLSVTDYDKSKAFYERALAPLGYAVLMNVTAAESGSVDFCGFGVAPKPDFWIDGAGRPSPKLHVCFRADTRGAVDAFYAAAIKAGGRDNGEPGLRPHYHPNYYGAFVLDPDGHNVEAVCHTPE